MVANHVPYINIAPGEIIKRDLETLNWTQDDLAKIIGMSTKAVNEIITTKTPINIESARLLSKAFGQSPQFWLNLETNYRLRLKTDEKKEKEAAIKALIYKYMPVREMIKKNWLPDYKNLDELIKAVKKFWQIDEIDFSFLDQEALPDFRKSRAYLQYNKYYALCWYQKAKTSAKNIQVAAYCKSDLEELANRLHRYTVMEKGIDTFLEQLNQAGVKFLVLNHLQKTYIDGASFYDQNNPVIVYTGRYNRSDNFWFTMAHEIAHILFRLQKGDYFIDDLESLENLSEKESNFFAEKILKVNEILDFFEGKYRYIPESLVKECRDQFDIAAGIIVSVLQYYKKLSRKSLNRYKELISDQIPLQYKI